MKTHSPQKVCSLFILCIYPIICILAMTYHNYIDHNQIHPSDETTVNHKAHIHTFEKTKASEKDKLLLAQLISAEARGEPYSGQVAVGAVVINRTQHPSFPDTIYEVCFQPGAFACVDNGMINNIPSQSCVKAAEEALSGYDPTGGAVYFYNPKLTSDKWMQSRPVIKTIGNHHFCI